MQESTELSRLALANGLVDVVIDSQPLQIAEALVNLLIELQTVNSFDPLRHRVYVPLQIVTSENTDA